MNVILIPRKSSFIRNWNEPPFSRFTLYYKFEYRPNNEHIKLNNLIPKKSNYPNLCAFFENDIKKLNNPLPCPQKKHLTSHTETTEAGVKQSISKAAATANRGESTPPIYRIYIYIQLRCVRERVQTPWRLETLFPLLLADRSSPLRLRLTHTPPTTIYIVYIYTYYTPAGIGLWLYMPALFPRLRVYGFSLLVLLVNVHMSAVEWTDTRGRW